MATVTFSTQSHSVNNLAQKKVRNKKEVSFLNGQGRSLNSVPLSSAEAPAVPLGIPIKIESARRNSRDFSFSLQPSVGSCPRQQLQSVLRHKEASSEERAGPTHEH